VDLVIAASNVTEVNTEDAEAEEEVLPEEELSDSGN